MKFLFLTPGYPALPDARSGSGIGTYVRELCLALQGRGHRCDILTWSDSGSSSECEIDGARAFLMPRRVWPVVERWWPDLGNAWARGQAVKRLQRLRQYDWIEIESDEGIDIAVQRRFPERVILRVHTTLGQMCREKKVPATGRTAAYLARERRSFRLARRVLVSSSSHAVELANLHPELPMAEVMPIGWGQARVEPPIEPRTGPPIFLYVGTLDRRKGVDRLPSILAEYALRYGPCELRIVSSSAESCLREFGLESVSPPVKVSRKSGLSADELNAEYRAAAALIHPARYESFGLPLIEAASVGTPVVASPTGVGPELCSGPRAGFLVNMDLPIQVSEALRHAVETRAETGRDFYRAYAEGFTRDRMAERYLELIEQWRMASSPP
jgi:glycosyltransferase involved in cell wall biosynthesis